MGQEASKPQRGKSLIVIGAGLPRTGTASFSKALEILLDGPVYHGGTQTTIGPEKNIRGWIHILDRRLPWTEMDRKQIDEVLRSSFDGFVATTDTPGHLYVEELMQLHPRAKVICTVRDPDKWAESIDKLSQTSLQPIVKWSLFWLPGLRYFPQYIDKLNYGRWGQLYGPAKPGKEYITGREVWDRHMAYLKRVVPSDRLVFFDVRDGWQPLCSALDIPVPADVEFPRINDGEATERFAKRHVQKGLGRWALAIAAAVATISYGAVMLR